MKHVFIYCSVLFVTCWIIGFIIFSGYVFSLRYTPIKETQAIVVLTGGTDRIKVALDLLQNHQAEKLFISGVHSTVSIDTLFQKVDTATKNKIHLGYQAENTYENALETDKWLQENNVTSILLVTSFYHMPRSLFEIKQRQKNLTILPYPIFYQKVDAAWLHTRSAWLLLKEYNKFLIVCLRTLLRRPFL